VNYFTPARTARLPGTIALSCAHPAAHLRGVTPDIPKRRVAIGSRRLAVHEVAVRGWRQARADSSGSLV
jgi:hypothetical protein